VDVAAPLVTPGKGNTVHVAAPLVTPGKGNTVHVVSPLFTPGKGNTVDVAAPLVTPGKGNTVDVAAPLVTPPAGNTVDVAAPLVTPVKGNTAKSPGTVSLRPAQVHSGNGVLNGGMKRSKVAHERGGVQVNLYYTNVRHIILFPVNDAVDTTSHTFMAAGGLSITAAIAGLEDGVLQGCSAVYIPVAQCRPYSVAVMKRKHWTFLEVTLIGDGQVRCIHYDSKVGGPLMYPLAHIHKELVCALKLRGLTLTKWESVYLGHQSVLDNVNCGRYVVASIHIRLSGHALHSFPIKHFAPHFHMIDESLRANALVVPTYADAGKCFQGSEPFFLMAGDEGSSREDTCTPSIPISQHDWDRFQAYVNAHCKGSDMRSVTVRAVGGMKLLQQLSRGETLSASSTGRVSDVCWGLMLYAVLLGQEFTAGSFDVYDPDHRVFQYLYSTPGCSGRPSSHYHGRTIGVPKEAYTSFGIKVDRDGENELPSLKRTVLFAKIKVYDGSDHTFIKMENWDVNVNAMSQRFYSLSNLVNTCGHTMEYLQPRPFVDDKPHFRKERLHVEDKVKLTAIIKQVGVCFGEKIRVDVANGGFNFCLPILRHALADEKCAQIHAQLEVLISSWEGKYGDLDGRTGNEVLVTSRLLKIIPSEPPGFYTPLTSSGFAALVGEFS
jgi:hypothetical protein